MTSKTFDPNDYVLIRERIEAFKADFPRRAIRTEIVKDDDKAIVIKATVWPDVDRTDCYFTGHAEEDRHRGEVNMSGSALENCETSAVGRALAFMGYRADRGGRAASTAALTEPTHRKILALCAGLRVDDAERDELIRREFGVDGVGALTEAQGEGLIERLKKRPRRKARSANAA
jgi:hypothetical protein